jgi:hypothetical protein
MGVLRCPIRDKRGLVREAAAVTLLLLQFISADTISRRTSVTLSGGSARWGEGEQALDNRDIEFGAKLGF